MYTSLPRPWMAGPGPLIERGDDQALESLTLPRGACCTAPSDIRGGERPSRRVRVAVWLRRPYLNTEGLPKRLIN